MTVNFNPISFRGVSPGELRDALAVKAPSPFQPEGDWKFGVSLFASQQDGKVNSPATKQLLALLGFDQANISPQAESLSDAYR